MLGPRIKQARQARGLSQRDAAERAGLTATAISKFERGLITPESGTLMRLAAAPETPLEFFFRPETVTLGRIDFRKRASLNKKAQARIEADVREQLERFFELLALFPDPPVRAFRSPVAMRAPIASLDEVERTAQTVRDAWSLGIDAVPDLADKLEEHGLVVLCTDVPGGRRCDGNVFIGLDHGRVPTRFVVEAPKRLPGSVDRHGRPAIPNRTPASPE